MSAHIPKKEKEHESFRCVFCILLTVRRRHERERERVREREKKTSNTSNRKTAIAHRKYTFSSSLTKGEGTYLSCRNMYPLGSKSFWTRLYPSGIEKTCPHYHKQSLQYTFSLITIVSDHYLIAHFFFTKHWSANSQSEWNDKV